MLGVVAEHSFEATPSDDEHAVEALSPSGAHESLPQWPSPVVPGPES